MQPTIRKWKACMRVCLPCSVHDDAQTLLQTTAVVGLVGADRGEGGGGEGEVPGTPIRPAPAALQLALELGVVRLELLPEPVAGRVLCDDARRAHNATGNAKPRAAPQIITAEPPNPAVKT